MACRLGRLDLEGGKPGMCRAFYTVKNRHVNLILVPLRRRVDYKPKLFIIMDITTIASEGGGDRPQDKNQNTRYERQQLVPESHDDFLFLADLVEDYIFHFEIIGFDMYPPDEWSQYAILELINSNIDQNSFVESLREIGLWAEQDGDKVFVDLADLDNKLFQKVFPDREVSITLSSVYSENGVVTPEVLQEIMLKKGLLESEQEEVFESVEEKKSVTKPEKSSTQKIQPLPQTSVEYDYELDGVILDFTELYPSKSRSTDLRSLDEKSKSYEKSWSIFDDHYEGKNIKSTPEFIAKNLRFLTKEVVRDSITLFDQVEHRLEVVKEINGITFVNDSKATNVNSAWYALSEMNAPVIWIAGGVDKGNDYSILYDEIREKVSSLICIGEDNLKLLDAFADKVDSIFEISDMQKAVQAAYDLGYPGTIVLLSPACASFDLFESYEHRGWEFKKAVSRF